MGFVLLLAALAALRLQLVLDLELGLADALAFGLWLGILYDFCVALLPSVLSRFATAATGAPRSLGWTIGAAAAWIPSLANVAYFRFFRTPLEAWIGMNHWRDLTDIPESPVALSMQLLPVASAALFVAAVAAAIRASRLAPEGDPATFVRNLARRAGHAAAGAAILAGALLIRQSPVWFGAVYVGSQHRGSVLTQQILVLWWDELLSVDRAYAAPTRERIPDPSAVLAAYRDFGEAATAEGAGLVRAFGVPEAETRRHRRALGLPETGPVNVLALFLESVRAHEIDDPETGPAVFPRLRELLASRAIRFTQAYSSSLQAGQTVRGQFSTLCSLYDDLIGPAVYLSHSTLKVKCLAGALREAGYRTAWLNSFRKNFHNKGVFEALHGTERFYDDEYFASRGLKERIGVWGFADGPFLQESLRALEGLAMEGGPFFANALTISTHHPFSVIPEGRLPEALLEATAGHVDYQGYLSRLRYVDESLGAFFESFFRSPLARNTLVVLMGDHSVSVPTHRPMDEVRMQELGSRIPLAFITAGLAKAETIAEPVHQVDVAPTIAAIAGFRGEAAWVGRDALATPAKGGLRGSPWVIPHLHRVTYRVGDRACYTVMGRERPRCFAVPEGSDPLLEGSLTEIPESPEETHFFEKFVTANTQLIERNQVMDGRAATAGSAREARALSSR